MLLAKAKNIRRTIIYSTYETAGAIDAEVKEEPPETKVDNDPLSTVFV